MEHQEKSRTMLFLLLLAELLVLALIVTLFLKGAFAGVGQNVPVETNLTIGNVFPEIINITLLGSSSIDLTANSTRNVVFLVIARDFNGDSEISSINATFFDNATSGLFSSDDNNNHYTNASCFIDANYGSIYEANATCSFQVWYYANNATWNVTAFVNDTFNTIGSGTSAFTVNTLLAVGLPDLIDYGTVNVTTVSDERTANVTNFGNVRLNLSLSGYGANVGDGNAMNCTFGSTKNISVYYEKYNLTTSNTSLGSTLTLGQFEGIYVNLTTGVTTKRFDLNYRQNDVANEAINATYWRIYIPLGVAGSCRGNIVFGATQATGT